MQVFLLVSEEEEEEEEEEVEIVEDESGQCIVQIKPKPIKLKINLSKDIPASRDLPTITDSGWYSLIHSVDPLFLSK